MRFDDLSITSKMSSMCVSFPRIVQLQARRFMALIAVIGALVAFNVSASVDFSANGVRLPLTSATTNFSARVSSIVYKCPVKEGRILDISGMVHDSTNNSRSAMIVVNFCDKDGQKLAVKELPYSSWSKGHVAYLSGGPSPKSFDFELKVPNEASYAEMRFDKRMNATDVKISAISCYLVFPRNLLRKLLAVCLLWALAGIGMVIFKHKRGPSQNPEGSAIASDEVKRSGICRIGYNVFKVCSIALALAVAVMFFSKSNVSLKAFDRMIVPAAVLGYVLFLLFVSALMHSVFGNDSRMRKFTIPVIMMACFALHFLAISLTHALFSQSMCSDFSQVERCIKSPVVMISHRPDFFYWCNYELLCSILGKVFGRDIRVAQYLNALCCVASIYPVFKLSERAAGFYMAVFTSLVMGLSPILSVYSTILTGEFVAAVMYIYAFYFIIRTLEMASWSDKVRYALFTGLFLGIAQLLKPLAVIFFVMAVIMVSLDVFRIGWRCISRWGIVFLILLGAYIFTSEVGQNAIAEIARPRRIAKMDNFFTKTLLLGLNVETGGGYNLDWINCINNLTPEEQKSLLRKKVSENFTKYPSLFSKKLDRMYADSKFGWSWYDHTISPNATSLWLKSSMCVWNYAVLLFLALGALGLSMTHGIADGKGRVGVAALLVISEFTCALLLLECQARYKTSIYPLFFLLIPYARTLFSRDNYVYAWVWRTAKSLYARGAFKRMWPFAARKSK